MYKEAVRDFSKEDYITLEQYLYVRNGMKGYNVIPTVSPHELKAFGIECMKKGWISKYGKESYPVQLAKKAAVIAINLKEQNSRVKNRLTEAFFLGDYDEKMVYLIENKSRHVKVGVSKSPKDRVKYLQTASGDKLTLLAAWKVKSRATDVESKLHKLFRDYNVSGEWFFGDQVDAELIESCFECEFVRQL